MAGRLSVDTCQCVLFFIVDDAGDPVYSRGLVCDLHQQCDDPAAIVLKENRLKNAVHAYIAEESPLTSMTVTDPHSGEPIAQMKLGISFGWEFDEARNLRVFVGGLTPEEKTQLASAISERFPQGVQLV